MATATQGFVNPKPVLKRKLAFKTETGKTKEGKDIALSYNEHTERFSLHIDGELLLSSGIIQEAKTRFNSMKVPVEAKAEVSTQPD